MLGGQGSDALDTLAHDLRLLRRAERGDESTLLEESKICHSAFTSFDRQGRGIGVLLDIDLAPRVALEMAGGMSPFPLFQSETLGTTAPWPARMRILLRPLPLLTLAATSGAFVLVLATLGHLKGYSGRFYDVGGADWHYLKLAIAVNNPSDWLLLGALPSFPIALFSYIANKFLPRRVRINLPGWMTDLARRYIALDRWFSEGDDHRAALHWVGRRLFGGSSTQGFALLALRNPDLWNADDLGRLHTLVESRPPSQALAIIVPIRHATQIASGLLLPWVDPVTRQPRPGLPAEIELIVLPNTTASTEKALPITDPLTLIGVETSDSAVRQRVYRDLRDDRLTINDLVPLVVFGSMPESPFVIAYDEQNSTPSLDDAVAPYVRFVSDNPAENSISLEPAEADARITRSAASMLHVPRSTKRTLRRLIGRGTYREELATALEPVFADSAADLNSYVRVLVGCGQLFNLREVAALLTDSKLSEECAFRIIRHLRAAAALAQTGAPFPSGSHRLEMLVNAWTEVADQLPMARISDQAGFQTLAVELIGLTFGAAAPLPKAGQSRLLSMMENFNKRAQRQTDLTLQDVFIDEFADVLSAISELDPEYADRLLERQLARFWKPIATTARARLSEHVAVLRAAKQPLAERLAGATSYETFAALLQAHAGSLPRFMALCYCLAARSAVDFERQQRLTDSMVKHRATGLQIDWNVRIDQPKHIGAIIDYLADSRTEEFIQANVRINEAEDDDDEYLYLGSFDRTSAEIQTIVEIILGRKAPPVKKDIVSGIMGSPHDLLKTAR